MNQMTFRPLKGQVLILADGVLLGDMPWQVAKEDAVELKRKAYATAEGEHVTFALRTEPMLGMELERAAAELIARGLHAAGARAEEHDVQERLVMETAFLARYGMPFGLTDNPQLQDAAWNEAQWNTQLRREIPQVVGQRLKVAVGTPTITVSPPKGKLQ